MWSFVLFSLLFHFLMCSTNGEVTNACDTLRQQCNVSLQNTAEIYQTSIPWPVTDEFIQQNSQKSEAYCRHMNETGHCLKNFLFYCPNESFFPGVNATKDWYHAEMYVALSRMCQTSISPLRYAGTTTHCPEFGPRFIEHQLHVHIDEFAHSSTSASTAQQNVCNTFRTMIDRMNSPAGTELATKCGNEVVGIILETNRQLLAADPYCHK